MRFRPALPSARVGLAASQNHMNHIYEGMQAHLLNSIPQRWHEPWLYKSTKSERMR